MKIEYSIPDLQTHGDASVLLEIFDFWGREIAMLVIKNQGQENYEAIFNGSRSAAGIHFYCLTSINL